VFEIVVLVCSLSLSQTECQEDSALDVVHTPATGSTMNCGLYGQAFVAQTSLARRLEGTYLKIRCGRPHGSAKAGGGRPVALGLPPS
jgi:hypothetical protein